MSVSFTNLIHVQCVDAIRRKKTFFSLTVFLYLLWNCFTRFFLYFCLCWSKNHFYVIKYSLGIHFIILNATAKRLKRFWTYCLLPRPSELIQNLSKLLLLLLVFSIRSTAPWQCRCNATTRSIILGISTWSMTQCWRTQVLNTTRFICHYSKTTRSRLAVQRKLFLLTATTMRRRLSTTWTRRWIAWAFKDAWEGRLCWKMAESRQWRRGNVTGCRFGPTLWSTFHQSPLKGEKVCKVCEA